MGMVITDNDYIITARVAQSGGQVYYVVVQLSTGQVVFSSWQHDKATEFLNDIQK